MPRDPLDRLYTPDALALACCRAVEHLQPRRILEPSVGGGAFVRAARAVWPGVQIVGVDLDPLAAGLAACDEAVVGDWPTLGTLAHADLVLGNPPFSGVVALAHVERALACRGAAVALILPWAYWGVDRWERLLLDHPPAAVRPLLPRPWPSAIRETALWLWRASDGWPTACRALRWAPRRGGS